MIGVMADLFTELKRRSVFKVGVAYAIVAWVLVQIGEIVLEAFGMDDWLRALIIVVAVGFPITLVLAWVYEMTPEGIKKDRQAKTRSKGGGLNKVIATALVLAVGFIIYQQVYDHYQEGSSQVSPDLEKSIAVLPFTDLSEKRDQEYFADGVAEEILNLLAKLDGLRVTSRSSSFSLKGQNLDTPTIGRKLGVNHILEGSIRRDGDQVRITAQLIEVETDTHLWSEAFDRDVTDIFAVQDEIALAIVEALKIEFSGGAMDIASAASASIDAYDLYLLGRHRVTRRTKEDLEEARGYFEAAIAADPEFAPARAGLGQSIIHLNGGVICYGDLTNEEVTALAVPELERALELDPKNASAYGAFGLYYLTLQNFSESEKALLKAIELNPSYAEAHTWLYTIYFATLRFELGLEALEKGFALDPLSLLSRTNYAANKIIIGKYDEAETISKSLIEDFPDHPFGYLILGAAYRAQGRMADALRIGLESLARGNFGEAEGLVREMLADFRSPELSQLALGRIEPLVVVSANPNLETTRRYLDEVTRDGVPLFARATTANLMIGGGDPDLAFALLESMFGENYHATSTLFDSLTEAFGPTAYAYLLRERGDIEAFEDILPVIHSRLGFFREGGKVHEIWFGYVRLLVLEGKNEEAINELSALVDRGFRGWYLATDFILEPLFDDPRFQEIVARIKAEVEAERQKAFAAFK